MRHADVPAVERIYRHHNPAEGDPSWRHRVELALSNPTDTVALIGEHDGRAMGYLVGEKRVWEFGSAPSGWIFAVGVDPAVAMGGLGSMLRDAAIERFRGLGVRSVRTMVRHDDVPVLTFFRSGGFRAGPYVELEIDLEEET
jgi:ribosomal protein S18 acetylase RimI-like enzyme